MTATHSKALIGGAIALALLVVALIVVYSTYGPGLKKELYLGNAPGFLEPLLPDRSALTLAEFSAKIDRLFWVRVVLGLPLTFLFAGALLLLFRYLLQSAEPDSLKRFVPSYAVRRGLLPAALLYGACTVLFFYPGLRNFSTHLIGPPEDNMQYLWGMWWGYEALINQAGSIIETNMIYYPEGTSLLYHSLSFYNLFLSFLLRQFLTPVATYNLLILHTFLLSGIGAYLLIRYLVGRQYLAIVGGFIYAFSPWHFAQSLHHINIASIQFLPFFVLFFIRLVRKGGTRNLVAAVLFFVLNALCSWNYLIFSGYFMLFAYLYLAIREKRFLLAKVAGKIVIVIIAGCALLSPWLVRMVTLGLQQTGISAAGHAWLVGDLVGLITPPQHHLIGNVQVVESINATFTGNPWEATVYLGLVALALIFLSYRAVAAEASRYLLAAISFLVLTFGAHLHVLGVTVPVILPYRLLALVPFLSDIRAPARNIVFVYLFLAVLVVIALKQIMARVNSKALAILLVCALSIALFLDYFSICRSYSQISVPACYQNLPRGAEEYGILDLPSGYGEVNRYLLYQTHHHLPIVQGWASRKIGVSLIDTLEMGNLARQRRQLTTAGVKYIVIHKELVTPGRPPGIEEYAKHYTLFADDESCTVWQVY